MLKRGSSDCSETVSSLRVMGGSSLVSTKEFVSESGSSSPVCLEGSSLGGVLGVSTVSSRFVVSEV